MAEKVWSISTDSWQTEVLVMRTEGGGKKSIYSQQLVGVCTYYAPNILESLNIAGLGEADEATRLLPSTVHRYTVVPYPYSGSVFSFVDILLIHSIDIHMYSVVF